MTKWQNFWNWYKCTSYPLGLIALGVLLALSIRAVGATATCTIAEYGCQYAISSKDAIAESVENLLVANRANELVIKKK